jgi:SnoaL-like domain
MATPIDLVTGYLRSFSGNDPDDIASFVSDGFRNEHLSELGSGCVGRAEYRRRLPHFLASFQDRSYTVQDLMTDTRESGTDVVVSYRFRARYADGPEPVDIDIPGVMWFSVHDDLISRRMDVWDSLTFMRQTGQ